MTDRSILFSGRLVRANLFRRSTRQSEVLLHGKILPAVAHPAQYEVAVFVGITPYGFMLVQLKFAHRSDASEIRIDEQGRRYD